MMSSLVLTGDQFTGTVANDVIRRIMDDMPVTEKQAEEIFRSRVKVSGDHARPPDERKRYRSTSHRPDAACLASSRAEAREFFRKLLGGTLPPNFRMERF